MESYAPHALARRHRPICDDLPSLKRNAPAAECHSFVSELSSRSAEPAGLCRSQGQGIVVKEDHNEANLENEKAVEKEEAAGAKKRPVLNWPPCTSVVSSCFRRVIPPIPPV